MDTLSPLPVPELATAPVGAAEQPAPQQENQQVNFSNGLLAEISKALLAASQKGAVDAPPPVETLDVEGTVAMSPSLHGSPTGKDLPSETVTLAAADAVIALPPTWIQAPSWPGKRALPGTGDAVPTVVELASSSARSAGGSALPQVAVPGVKGALLGEDASLATLADATLADATLADASDEAMRMRAAESSTQQSRGAAAVEHYVAESRGVTDLQQAGPLAGLQRAGAPQGIVRGGPLEILQPRAFGDGLANQVTMLIGAQASQARLAITPPELGPVDVRIRVSGDDISVQLAAVQPGSREALEAALPRLRSALQDAGFHLADGGVFEQLPQQHHGTQDESAARPGHAMVPGEEADPGTAAQRPLQPISVGLVDAFV